MNSKALSDFGGGKACLELSETEIRCMAHARRKFFELHATHKALWLSWACVTSRPCTKWRVS